jgi:predicted phosphodiesterase
MKLLIISDLHGRKSWHQWLASHQPELLVMAGKHLFIATSIETGRPKDQCH